MKYPNSSTIGIRQKFAGCFPIFICKARSLLGLIYRNVKYLMVTCIIAPLILVIVVIRPFILFRFGTMWAERIGPFSGDVEVYLCTRDQIRQRRLTIDIIGCPEPVCNRQLQKMWARTITITSGAKLWTLFDRCCQFWTRSDKHHIKLTDRAFEYGVFLSKQPQLSFTEEEKLHGLQLLEHMGIPANAHWICIHNRDSAYLDKMLGGRWAYHDYRDFSVQTMIDAAEEMTRRGYYVLRMGAIVAEPLCSVNPKIIDYANSPLRSDFADIYLMAKSIAYLGSDSGIATVPLIFRKPLFYINFSPGMIYILTYFCPWPFIIKHLWSKKDHRFLSLRKIFEIGLGGASSTGMYEEHGVELIDNTPEEIRDLAVEVDDRVNGQWQVQPEDEELQARFRGILRQYIPSDHRGDIQINIGSSFLRKHMYLLD